ncbi:MAG: hypothetical protein HY072_06625 [Deltaproteobacteria bacterium]|nr:hypothetical protein [Deltaproteobacteria bacterium]
MANLLKEKMLEAFRLLDQILKQEVTLIMGGGGSMILAHGFHLGTADIDAIPKGIELNELDPLVKQIAKKLEIAPDWLNPYFSTFSHTLPLDYGDRLIEVFSGKKLKVLALGKEEMLIMKCFAHRQKDIPHAKLLIKKSTDIKMVESHIEGLMKKRIPGAQDALDFLDDVMESVNEGT